MIFIDLLLQTAKQQNIYQIEKRIVLIDKRISFLSLNHTIVKKNPSPGV